MSAIRPDLPVVQPQTSGSASSSVRQAQAAFFRAALGEAQAAQVQTGQIQPAQVRANPVSAVIRPQTSEPAPSATGRSMRPGSLLDIKV